MAHCSPRPLSVTLAADTAAETSPSKRHFASLAAPSRPQFKSARGSAVITCAADDGQARKATAGESAADSGSSDNAATAGVSHLLRERRAQVVKERRNKRFAWFALGGLLLGGGMFFTINAFQDSFMFYVTPTDLLEKIGEIDSKTLVRLGGLVLDGSLKKGVGARVDFIVTDLSTDIYVRYNGLLPDLFREGKSVVVEGYFDKLSATFNATLVLAKHDENYMPKDVADALEKSQEKKDRLEKLQAQLEAEKARA